MRSVTICASASFYKKVIAIKNDLENAGITVYIPATAKIMESTGDFDVSHYKTWFGDSNEYDKKADLIRNHFKEIEKVDVILVINDEKHGVHNYIGGNVLMEMAIAFHCNKPIYLLNDIPAASQFEEEIRGVGSIPLHGNLQPLTDFCK